MTNRAVHIRVADVAEDPAREHEVRGDPTGERGGHAGVRAHELHPRQSLTRDLPLSGRDELGREVDEARPYVVPTRVIGEHSEQVASIPRAQAEHADLPGRRPTQGLADAGLHEP